MDIRLQITEPTFRRMVGLGVPLETDAQILAAFRSIIAEDDAFWAERLAAIRSVKRRFF